MPASAPSVRSWSEGSLLLAWYTATLFLSAFLLFLVQPMFAKMALPKLGGAPAVWNTCMVFFQATLLAGYAYAHGATAWLGARRQAALHVGFLLLPLLTLPIGMAQGWAPPVQHNPIPWLLLLLVVSVGLPFFVVSTSAPMLQRWFASTSHPLAKDPYFLYGASNLGSLLALLAYPVLIEPHLTLSEQGRLWAACYGLLVFLTFGCGLILWRSSAATGELSQDPAWHREAGARLLAPAGARTGLTLASRTRWVALSFVPSSLMLGVTTYLGTEIPAIPLLWVVPLALYLLTFILVFAREPIVRHGLMVRALPIVVLPLAIWIPLHLTSPLWLFVPLHLLGFFAVGMVCHGELARSRPPAAHLTEFYLLLSVGGVLGGVFNALVAPMVFKTVVEYSLAIVLACMLLPSRDSKNHERMARWLDFALPLALAGLVAALFWGAKTSATGSTVAYLGLIVGPPPLCFSFRHRPIRLGLGVAAIIVATTFFAEGRERLLYAQRSFFGVHRIKEGAEGKYRMLVHGSTMHGAQSLDQASRREPLAYYSRTGPIGQVFSALSGTRPSPRVAIVGLGTGSMACYAEPGQQFTFYEIDPTVERIARNPAYFTFLQECQPKIDVVLGDARLSLAGAPDEHYGLIVLDAFSADAIPLHLLTREAIRLYLSKLADGGILAFHISNRHLDLRWVLSDLARDAGLVCLFQADQNITEADRKIGKSQSWWAVMAGRRDDFGRLAGDSRWTQLRGSPDGRVWTDDFSNILNVIRWR